MAKNAAAQELREETPVDDVRRIRRRISDEDGGDIRKHIEQSQRIAEQLRDKLGLKPVVSPRRRRGALPSE